MEAMIQNISVGTLATAAVVLVGVAIIGKFLLNQRRHPNTPPAVPGWPLIGNLLQLREKKPFLTFVKWAEDYGPIYSIRCGASSMIVLNSTELAKEVLFIAYKRPQKSNFSISSKFQLKATIFNSLRNKFKYHSLHLLIYMNGTPRDGKTKKEYMHIKEDRSNELPVLFYFSSRAHAKKCLQSLGKDVESIYVEEHGMTMTKKEMLQILVIDPMMGAIEVDWRDFFPYLRWVPNNSMETKIRQMATRKRAVTKALINEQRQRIARREEISYVDYLLSKETTLTEEQFIALVWESIIETSDTTLITTEWAMYELSKNQKCQDRLYQEIQKVCGSKKFSEENIQHLPYLSAVFHETLRFHSPVSIIPPRHVHEDTQLGGYNIPAGTDIIINLYACNMHKKDWEEPESWKPERFLSDKYELMDMHKTMAFGGGKRACAGSLQAMLISCTAIGRLIQEFHWKLKDGEEDNIDTVQLTTHKRFPMQAYIRARGIEI
ncbi:ent-kaurene oxidase 2-like [Dendrobium catenatum]|uniref:ent-kaurene oxidase 2-like n=1 Tax=Dendrobium catenatum TaxID=906689 RepID=UPI00109F397F|nr:ent-kaurene oxidase 2-like [Dendrobium catenatum]